MTAHTQCQDGSTAVSVAEDRRRSERRRYVCEAWLCSPTSSDPSDRIWAQGINISRHGIAFDSDQAIEPGTFWVVEILVGAGSTRTEVRISHCRPVGEGRFEIGAEFC